MTLTLMVDMGLFITAGNLWSARPLRGLSCPGIVLCVVMFRLFRITGRLVSTMPGDRFPTSTSR